MNQYVALLRGINVGGKNLIKMTALEACLEEQGLLEVRTYIQSGNVLFQSAEGRVKLTNRMERTLASRFNYQARVVLRSKKQLLAIIEGAPKGFGLHPGDYRYDVLFLKEPLTAPAAMKSVLIKQGVDEVAAGSGVLYFSRLISRARESQLSRIVSMPVYQNMTIRNWNTTTKLLGMMESQHRPGAATRTKRSSSR